MGLFTALINVTAQAGVSSATKRLVNQVASRIKPDEEEEEQLITKIEQSPNLSQGTKSVVSSLRDFQLSRAPTRNPLLGTPTDFLGRPTRTPFTRENLQKNIVEPIRQGSLIDFSVGFTKGLGENVSNTSTAVNKMFLEGLNTIQKAFTGEDSKTLKGLSKANTRLRSQQKRLFKSEGTSEKAGDIFSQFALFGTMAVMSEAKIADRLIKAGFAKNTLTTNATASVISDMSAFGVWNAIEEVGQTNPTVRNWAQRTGIEALFGLVGEAGFKGLQNAKTFANTAPREVADILGGKEGLKNFYEKTVKVVDKLKASGVRTAEEAKLKIRELSQSPEAQAFISTRGSIKNPFSRGKGDEPEVTPPRGKREIIQKASLNSTTRSGEIPTTRNLQEELRNLISKQNEKIDDGVIRSVREKLKLDPETIDEIIARKRGVVTDKQAIERARNMRVNVNDILNLPRGTTLNKEQITAVKQVLQNEREVNKKLIQLREGTSKSTPEERELIRSSLSKEFKDMPEDELLNQALAESTLKLKKLEIITLAIGSEAGRALQGLKQQVAGVDGRLRAIYQRIKKKTPLEQQAIIERIAKAPIENNKNFINLLDKLNDADFFDKAAEWITSSKLWNPTTHVVNLTGNTVRQLTDVVATAASDPRAIAADMSGALVGLGKGLRNAFRAFSDEGYAQSLSKYIEEGGRAPAIKGKLGKVIRTPFTALSASDEIFKGVAFSRSLYRQAFHKAKGDTAKMKEILEAPTFKMLEEATEASKKMTFQEDMGEIIKILNRARTPDAFKKSPGKAFSLMVRYFVPFLKTPVNLFKQAAVDFSPIGLIKNVDWSKGNTPKNRKAVAEVAIGVALATWAWNKSQEGEMTGGVPRDKAERDQFYREKKLPYAVKVGDKWIQYQRLDPFSTIIGLTTDISNMEQDKKGKIGSYFGVLSEQMRDKTFLRGLDDFMNLFVDEESEGWKRDLVFRNIAANISLPSFVGHTARTIDPVIREIGSAKDAFIAQIPGLSKTLPPRIDALGNTIERANKGLEYFFNPFQNTDIQEIDAVTDFLMRTGAVVKLPNKSPTVKGISVKFNEKEYSDYSLRIGQIINKVLLSFANMEEFEQLSQEEVQEVVDKLRSEVVKSEKEDFLIESGALQRVLDELKESGEEIP